MKRLIPLLLLVLVGGIAVYLHPQWFHKAAPANMLKLSGNIEAHESLVSFKVTGRIVELPVDEGMTVDTGTLLARLDNDDYRQQVAVDEASAHQRSEQLSLALAGSRQQDIEAAKLAMLDAQADLEQKKKDYGRYAALYAKDEIPGQTRDQAATNVTRAQDTYDRAQQVYSELVEGTRKEQLAVDRANMRQANQVVDLSHVRLSYTKLLAPFSGVVLVRQAELGEVVSPGTPIVTLGDLDHLWVRVYVPETDLGKVHFGQTVDVHTDSFPNRTFPGRIAFISSEAEFTPKSVQTEKERVTLVYRVKVDLSNPQHELKPGMPADVDVKFQ
jgi:HlyD family secretion protein